MKEVLIIVDNICWGAGTKRAAINLAEILTEQGYKVTIVSLFTSIEAPFYPVVFPI